MRGAIRGPRPGSCGFMAIERCKFIKGHIMCWRTLSALDDRRPAQLTSAADRPRRAGQVREINRHQRHAEGRRRAYLTTRLEGCHVTISRLAQASPWAASWITSMTARSARR